MRLSISATAVCFTTLLMLGASVEAAPPPGCKRTLHELTELETSTGRVVALQLIGKKSHWAEVAQQEVSQWLFEPLVDGDVGITRVGVTAAVIAELEGRGQSCGTVQSPVKPDLEVRVCASL